MLIRAFLLLSEEEIDSILHFTPIAVTTRLIQIGLLYVYVFCAGRWGWGWSLYALFCLLFFWFYFKKNRLLFLRKLLHFIVAVDLSVSLLTTEESSGEENT